MNILLLHAIRDLRSLRRTTLNQSFCLLKHAPEHEYTLHCFGHAVTSELREREFDAIVIDTTFLWYRWARPRSILAELLEEYQFIAASRAAKVALPQDDYDHAAILDEWLAAWGVNAVFSPMAKHADLLFPLTARRAAILPCFTGHLDPADRALAACFGRPFEAREIDVGYRAADLPAQFGRLGRIKSEIGQRFALALGLDHGLCLDISTDPQDALSGDQWLRFLCNSRFTLGSVSGSSLVDPRGRIADAIRDYSRDHPGAPFDEIEAACFPGQDGKRELAGIGPRNIETALAESCQILVTSPDLAPFEPDVHYIPLAPDCSNIAEVRRQMRDTALVGQRIAAALELVCETPSFRVENFARRILAEVARVRESNSPTISRRSGKPAAADAVQSLLAEQRIMVRLAEAELAQRTIDAAAVAPASVDDLLERKLTLRTGRFGGLREMLGVNDAILPDGSIDFRVSRTRGLQAYFILRRARDRAGAARASLRRGRRRLARAQQRLRGLRQRLHGHGIRSGLRTAAAEALSVGGAVARRAQRLPRQSWQLLNSLRRNVLPSAVARTRKALGLPSTPRRTITMLVGDDRIDRRVLLSARSLHRAGWRVRVIALPHPGPRDDDQRMFPEIDIFRIVPNRYPAIIDNGTMEPRSPLAARGWEWHGVYPYYFHFLELAVRHPARIFVAHDLPALASAIVAAQAFGSRVIYDAHELYPEQHHFEAEYADVLRRAEAELIGYTDLVTTVNRSIAQEMAERYRIAQPAVILNAPAASPEALPLRRNQLLRDRLGVAASQRVLLFQGRLSPNRNLETLARAMALVRRHETVLVFLGPDGGKRDELEEIAAELGLRDKKIYFLDPVPQDELLSWTAAADVGIVPYPPIDLNSRLCTPNKLFEFIVAEVPILANDLPELRRFVVENNFGIVRAMHDPAAIAAAIDEVMSSDPTAWRAALRARSREFVWEFQGYELARLYRRFLAWAPVHPKHDAFTSPVAGSLPDQP